MESAVYQAPCDVCGGNEGCAEGDASDDAERYEPDSLGFVQGKEAGRIVEVLLIARGRSGSQFRCHVEK